MATPFGHTPDGFETQFGTNHLGHFVLVNRIAPLLRAGGRLINLSSAGHRFANVDLEDPNFERTPYEPFVAYGRSRRQTFSSPLRSTNGTATVACVLQRCIRGASKLNWRRHMDQSHIQEMLDQIDQQLAAEDSEPFQWKTIPQGAATSVWAGCGCSCRRDRWSILRELPRRPHCSGRGDPQRR